MGASASLRQQMEQHRKSVVCASCHARMDPLGFGLENYDAVGAWRQQDGKFPIDASGVLPDGRMFQGADGLKIDSGRRPGRVRGMPGREDAHLCIGARS